MRYFNIADIGMASASTHFAATYYAQGDTEAERRTIWTAICITSAMTSAAAALIIVAAPFLVDTVLNVPPHLRQTAVVSVQLIALAAVAYAVGNSVSTPQQVRLQWKRLTLATSGPRVIQTASAPLVLLLVAGGTVTTSSLLLGACVAAAVLNFGVAVRLQPAVRRPTFSLDLSRPLFRYGAALAVSGLATIPLMTAERFFLAYFHSTTAVAHYAVAAALGSVLAVIPTALSQPMLPALTRLGTSHHQQDRYQLYQNVLRALFLTATPAALLLLFVARPLIGLWAGPEYEASSVEPFYIIVIGLWFNTLAFLPFMQLLAGRHTRFLAIFHLAELGPYFLLAAFLTNSFGPVGAAVAWSTHLTVEGLAYFLLVSRRYHLPWQPTPDRGWLALASLVALGSTLCLAAVFISSLPGRMAAGTLLCSLFALASYLFVLTSPERRSLRQLVRELIPDRVRPLI